MLQTTTKSPPAGFHTSNENRHLQDFTPATKKRGRRKKTFSI